MICIGCGCDEGHACNVAGEACQWIHVGPMGLAGICSACLELFPPSTIELELAQMEVAIAEAADLTLNNRVADAGELGSTFALPLSAQKPGKLILPGDPEFHL